MKDDAFQTNQEGLHRAIELLSSPTGEAPKLPETLPDEGTGEKHTLEALAPLVLGGAQRLESATAFAHMDPPTPWITWAVALWNASLNQNLLHPDVGPVARDLEEKAMQWISPVFGMSGGHMTPGSTVSNLTALWAARELRGVTRVMASEGAHISVAKSAHILGLDYVSIAMDENGRFDSSAIGGDLGRTALVLTAGATSTGAIDPLSLVAHAAWTHVDAAWAGPMRYSSTLGPRLDGIENADSIAISTHKWLFQPKESALVLFRDAKSAHDALSFGGAYLATPNVGLLGSHGANATVLLATLMAWGRKGVSARIEHTFGLSEQLRELLAAHPDVKLFPSNDSGVVLWRPSNDRTVAEVYSSLPKGTASLTRLHDEPWLRHVAANPNADLAVIFDAIATALD